MSIQEWKLFFFPNPQRKIYNIATSICLFLILLQAMLTLYFWFHAPPKIPIHYNIKGTPDRYGNKNNVWSLLLISTVLFILLTGLIKSKFIYKNFSGAPEDFEKIDVKTGNMTKMIFYLLRALVTIAFFIISAITFLYSISWLKVE